MTDADGSRRLVRPRVSARDLGAEALAGVVQRPMRSVLTGLGAAIGVCAVVVVLGLTASASARVNERFDALRAREVTVGVADDPSAQPGSPADAAVGLPASAAARIREIPGVGAAGRIGTVDLGSPSITSLPLSGDDPASASSDLELRSVDASAWSVLRPHVTVGRLYDAGHERRGDRVAVLGIGAARRLGISRLDATPAVFVDGVAFTVIGIVDDLRRDPELLRAVLIPPAGASAVWNIDPADDTGAVVLVETDLGAASVIADRIPLVVDPAQPERVRVEAPPDPKALSDTVGSDLDVLSLTLAAVSVLLGALGISNTMLVTVMERVHEIGLRRALGAGGGHIAFQFLIEAAVLGGMGGLVGSTVGVAAVIGVCLVREWTPVLESWVVVAAPLLGLVSGLLAGVFPAWRAARIQPADALRR